MIREKKTLGERASLPCGGTSADRLRPVVGSVTCEGLVRIHAVQAAFHNE